MPQAAQPLVWFITGTSTGIGRVLAQKAAEAGHFVTATARSPEKLADLQNLLGDKLLVLRQDVNDSVQNAAAVRAALAHWGRIDVLMNNAGYGLEGAVEEVTMAQVRQQLETNFFGLVDCIQQVLPGMRAQGSGYIINVASIAGLRGYNGLGIYNASKFAVVGLSEALRMELKPFNIKVSCVEPGPYRTDWAGRSIHHSPAMDAHDPQSPYADLNAKLLRGVDGQSGRQSGDPAQIASVLLSAAQAPEPPLHMVFGDEAIQVWQDKLTRMQDRAYMDFFPHTRHQL